MRPHVIQGVRFFHYLGQHEILLALFLIALIWFAVRVGFVIAVFFSGYILMAGFYPIVQYFERRNFPRFLAILMPYIPIIALIILLSTVIAPQLLSQTLALSRELPQILHKAGQALHFNISLASGQSFITSQIQNLASNLFAFTATVFRVFIFVVAMFVISVYMILERDKMYGGLADLFPVNAQSEMRSVLHDVERKLGDWFRGQLILSLAVGVLSFVFLFFTGIPYSLTLGFLAAVFEVIPYAGPIFSAIPAIVVALNISFSKGIVVLIGYIVIHQIEGHLLAPNILHKSIQLSPLIIIGTIILGTEAGGILGALLAVPVASVLQVLIRHSQSLREVATEQSP